MSNHPTEAPGRCDTLICGRFVLPVDPGTAPIIELGAIAVTGTDIVAVGSQTELQRQFQPDQLVELPNAVLLPGLVNTHGHAAMTLLRGLGDGHSLQGWLEKVIWPLERDHVDAEFVRDGTDLAIAEMLRSGTTCFSDMYFLPQVAAERAQAAGIRAQLAFPVIDVPNVWSANAEAGMSQGLELYDALRHDPLVSIAFGPHSTYTLTEATLVKVGTYAEEIDARIEIHLHENAAEFANKRRPLALLNELGMLSPRLQAVHVTQLEDAEIELLQQTGVKVSHCPASNMKLASGSARVRQLLDAGVTVGLGTDGAASNDALDMLQEARLALLLTRLNNGSDTFSAAEALNMATYGGAKVLGLEQQIGQLVAGKAADIIAIDSRALALQPLHDPVAQLVHCAGNYQVSDVWVAGRRLLGNGELLTLDEQDIVQRATRWQQRLQG